MNSQIEAYEQGLERLHAEIRRLELIIKKKNKTIASLRRVIEREESAHQILMGMIP